MASAGVMCVQVLGDVQERRAVSIHDVGVIPRVTYGGQEHQQGISPQQLATDGTNQDDSPGQVPSV